MRHEAKCSCGCRITYETTDSPPKKAKCYRCGADVKFKESEEVVDEVKE